jgi:hypothetical protein
VPSVPLQPRRLRRLSAQSDHPLQKSARTARHCAVALLSATCSTTRSASMCRYRSRSPAARSHLATFTTLPHRAAPPACATRALAAHHPRPRSPSCSCRPCSAHFRRPAAPGAHQHPYTQVDPRLFIIAYAAPVPSHPARQYYARRRGCGRAACDSASRDVQSACASSITVSAAPPTMSSTFRAPAVLRVGLHVPRSTRRSLAAYLMCGHWVHGLRVGDEEMYVRKVCDPLVHTTQYC